MTPPRVTLPDRSLVAAKARASLNRRAFWQVRYHDGRIVSEWQCDWLDLPHQGRVALRLVCPNGQVGEVGNSTDATGRLFQFKLAHAVISTGGVLSGRTTVAQLIGILNDAEGNCTLFAWEPKPGRLVGPLPDNIRHMAYGDGRIGALASNALGLRPD